MSADSPRRSSGCRGGIAVPAIVPPQVVSDRSILDSAIGFINDVTLAHQPHTDPKDTITWARFESAADISDPRHGEDWELDGNVAPPLLLILGYGLGVQVWAIPANGEAVEVLSWRHGIVSALRVLPTPNACASSSAMDGNGRADEPVDAFADKRTLIAMVDGGSSTGAQSSQFSAVNFVSLKTGAQVKTIKFKNPVLDILANRSSIAITFHERIAVFDARTLEDRLSITTCYPSPGINPNPVALGPRWLAYAEHKLLHSKRSGGGCDGDGVASYTATMLNAAKSFGKGLRELGEQVAAGLTGTSAATGGSSKSSSFDSNTGTDAKQPGMITVMDIKHLLREYSPSTGTPTGGHGTGVGTDPTIVHFIAHSDAVVALEFDNSGMLLVTADRRGHDFHVFRIQPHPVGSSLAAVHHLYVLHRGDTSAKVQNIAFSLDSRWVAVSTLRGTTHVFPITPYGGAMGVRTHSSLHVVNKLSRFHRSAGLSAEGRSSSPISHSESTTFIQSLQPYHNPSLPPYPRPTVVLPLAQLRQPMALGSPPGSATLSGSAGKIGGVGGGSSSSSQRQRLSSLSDDSGKPLSICAIFAKSRSWLLDPPNATREAPHRIQRKAVDSLFVMAGHGALIQYDLDTKLASNVAKEKICDDTPIELEVEAKAQWNLGRRKDGSQEIMPPLSSDNWLIKDRNSCMLMDSTRHYDDHDDRGDSWLSQVEIITHAGPHRRLWMGPQFVFKTYNTPSGSNLSHVDAEAVEIGVAKTTAAAASVAARLERSSPLNMPLSMTGHSAVPVLIESGSYSSIEQSPKLMDRFRHEHLNSDFSVAHGDTRLKEDLADAMRESPCAPAVGHKDPTGRLPPDAGSSDNVPFYDALAEHDDDDQPFEGHRSTSVAALASALPNIFSYETQPGYESLDSLKKQNASPSSSIEKVVNPLGTVTTVTSCMSADVQTDILDEVVSQLAAEDCVIHENCDESLFRPVVAIFCDENPEVLTEEEARRKQELCKPPEVISNKLIVPVIDKAVDEQLSKKEKEKSGMTAKLQKKDTHREEGCIDSKDASFQRKPAGSMPASAVEARRELVKDEKAVKAKKQVELEKVLAEQRKEVEKCKKETTANANFPPKIALSEEEKPIEFKRMTPQKDEKPTTGKQIAGKIRKADNLESKLKRLVAEKDEAVPESEVQRVTDKHEESKGSKQAKPEEVGSTKKDTAEKANDVEIIKLEILPQESIRELQSSLDSVTPSSSKKVLEENTQKVTKTVDTSKMKCYKNKAPDSNDTEVINIRMESLNVPDLVSSLLELPDLIDGDGEVKESDVKPQRGEIIKCAELPEPVEIYSVLKLSKKSKKQQNKSGSNSESEEVVEVVCSGATKPTNNAIEPDTKIRKLTDSKDGFCDWADSLLASKGSLSETMYVSAVEQKDENCKSGYRGVEKTTTAPTVEKEREQLGTNKSKIEDKTVNTMTEMAETKTPIVQTETKKVTREQPAAAAKEEKKATATKNSDSKKELAPSEKPQQAVEERVGGKSKSKNDLRSAEEKDAKKEQVSDNVIKYPKDMWHEKQKETTKKPDIQVVVEETKKIADNTKSSPKAIVSKNVEVKPKEATETKPDGKSDKVSTSKSQKKAAVPSVKANVDLMPPPSPPGPLLALTTGNNVSEEAIKYDSTCEGVQVITEQPMKTKCNPQLELKENKSLQKYDNNKKSVDISDELHKGTKEKSKTTPNTPTAAANSTTDSSKNSKSEKVKTSGGKEPIVAKVAAPPFASAWKTLSGAEMIGQKLERTSGDNAAAKENNYPKLGKLIPNKSNVKITPSELASHGSMEVPEKLLPDIPSPLKPPENSYEPLSTVTKNKKTSKEKATSVFNDFPLLKPLDSLPPLPVLAPLEVISSDPKGVETIPTDLESLINFESPLQENPALERKITPPPRGFTEQNLIFALCGSLHYENESSSKASFEKGEPTSPTHSLTCSTSYLGEQSAADYKSMTENDDQYMSLEQSSQDTTTANTTTTNEKLSSSPSSSACEEILIAKERKITKKQKRKKQQMDIEKQKEQLDASTHEADVDEELRPLISMSDSHSDPIMLAGGEAPLASSGSVTLFMEDDCFLDDTEVSMKAALSAGPQLVTTDSESPMPATTSDDNCFTLPASLSAASSASAPNKVKTKKLEHKINLLAAIEAATSSSTSSAEESGVEASGGRSLELDPVVVLGSAPTATSVQSLIHATANNYPGTQQGGAKKKTKRRKR